MFCCAPILLAIVIVVVFRFLNKEDKPPILGIYQQANKTYWFKFIFMYVVLNFRQLVNHLKRLRAVEKGESDDGNIHIHKNDAFLEETHALGSPPLAVDAVYFNGTSKTGAAVMCNVARRQNGVCDGFFFLNVDGSELLLSPSLPDTYLKQEESEEGYYKVAGICIENIVPMRAWKIEYEGELKSRTDPTKKVSAKVSLTWSTSFEHFNYDSISPLSMARDMAREKWSKDYFDMLKRFHQHHYEQAGVLHGTATLDGKEHEIHLPCLRDHSFGKHRDWRNFHRYVYHFIYLENGDYIAVGSASQPMVLSHLTIGYYCRAKDQRVFPVDWSDFHLFQHGENQVLPKDYGFSFSYDGKTFAVQVLVNDEETFYIGKDREAKFYERWCKYQVGSQKGWGCAEWHYNNQGFGKA